MSAINKFIIQGSFGGRLVKWKGRTASIAPGILFATVSAIALTTGGLSRADTYTYSDTSYNNIQTEIVQNSTISVTSSDYGTSTSSTSSAYSYAEIHGIEINSISNGGSITNTGSIKVDAKNVESIFSYSSTFTNYILADASGISIDGNASGYIKNTGKIEVTNVATSDYNSGIALASGIIVGENVLASIINSGTINVDMEMTTASISGGAAYGINFGDIGANGKLENSGLIVVSGVAAHGIYGDGALSGEIINSSSSQGIEVNADGLATDINAIGVGIFQDELSGEGKIVNNGKIAVNAYSYTSASLAGVVANTIGESGSISNNGKIDISATVHSVAAIGFGVNAGDVAGNITNSGTISIDAVLSTGIFVQDKLSGTITNTSDGTISVNGNGSDTTGSAAGIYIGNINEGGLVSNLGNIEVEASAFASSTSEIKATAYGIHVDTLLIDGSITNSGTVEVVADANNTSHTSAATANITANAYGVYVDSADGSIINSGTIYVSAEADVYASYTTSTSTIVSSFDLSASANAYGILVNTLSIGGSITNSGTINVEASADASSASSSGSGTIYASEAAYGIYVGDAAGNIDNSGNISANAESNAHGIYVDGTLTATIKNNGTGSSDGIFVGNASSSPSSSSFTEPRYAEGIFVDTIGDGGSISNSGLIDAKASFSGSAFAYGINVKTLASGGSISNSGLIDVSAEADSSSAFAYGINVKALESGGSITNSGTIDVDANNYSSSSSVEATAIGIYVENNTGSITNDGNITVNASATFKTAKAYGIQTDTVSSSGAITNSGDIKVTVAEQSEVLSQRISLEGIAPSLDVYAAGIYVDTLEVGGTISNTGNIDITNNQTGGIVSGIFVNKMNGTISDVGTITTADEGTYAIYLKDGTGTLKLTADDDVTGLIHVNAHDVTIDATGQSAVFNFEDENIEAGEFDTKTNEYSGSWMNIGNEDYPIYSWSAVSINSADMDTSSMAVPIFGNLLNELSAPCATPKEVNGDNFGLVSECPQIGISSSETFFAISRDRSEFSGSNGANDTAISTNSATLGYGGFTSSGTWIAAGAGQYVSKGESLPNSAGTSGYFVGYTLGKSLNNFYAETGLGYGISKTHNNRKIIGSEDAKSTFDSDFTTAHIGLKRSFELSNSMDLQLFGSARYSKQTNDRYTETNSSANATVAERDIVSMENELGIEAIYNLNKGARLIIGMSAVTKRMSGDETMNITIGTEEKDLKSTLSDYSGQSLTLEYQVPVSVNGQFKFGAERKISESTSWNAGLRWSF
ncbi:autotransporter domain-containing protein [Amylibacter sp.]|nr:autotransporter domain-containing protein [Amylibacter sp.]